MSEQKRCCICGALLTGGKCMSCGHGECPECEVYVPWPTVETLTAQIAALTAENARLKAPVIPDWEQLERFRSSYFANGRDWKENTFRILSRWEERDRPEIIAARASTPPDANTSWFCVPCGFTTRDAAEAQAHLGPHMIEITCPFDEQIWRFHTQEQADMLQKHLDWHAAQKEGRQ